MSTNPADPQAPEGAPETDFDELTGVYGFFRRHQKKLLYTAGLFTLLTFSITGPMQALVSSVFNEQREMASIVVAGERVRLAPDDYTYGNLLARNFIQGMPQGILPWPQYLRPAEGDDDGELGDVFAVLRRVAIVEGVEPSMIEVDAAIDTAREQAKYESAAELARKRGFSSLAEYRRLVAEAMRIGTLVRTQLLALDTSDAEVIRQLLRDREKATFRVAMFDEAAREEAMKAETELTREDLETWLADQTEPQKTRMGVYGLPQVQLVLAAAMTAEGQFDASQWADGVLKDFTIEEDQLRSVYDQERDARFKIEKKVEAPKEGEPEDPKEKDPKEEIPQDADDVEYREFEDEAVQAELTRIVQAERVMNDLNTKLRQKQVDVLKPLSDAVAEAQSALQAGNTASRQANAEKAQKEAELKQKQELLAANPEDEDLKKQVAELEAGIKTLETTAFEAEAALPALENAAEAAKEEERVARAGFDFATEFAALTEGKSGFVVKNTDKLLTSEDLADLDKLELDLGTWSRATMATSLRDAGSIGNAPGRTSKAIVIYQATASEPQPQKPWEDLEPLLRDAYWTEKAAAEGRDKKQAMEDTMLRLAKEKIPEFVTEHEAEKESRLAEKTKEWEENLKVEIAEAEEMVARKNLGTKPRQAWENKLTQKKRELDLKVTRTNMFTNQVDNEIKNEIAEEARKHYASVIDAAAQEVGFEVMDLGPLPRDIAKQPRFEEVHGKAVGYVFQQHGELEKDESIGPVIDSEERRCYLIVCTESQPLEVTDLTRREFFMSQKNFDFAQLFNGLSQAFTEDSLAKRYQLEKPRGEMVDGDPESASVEDAGAK
ncbi:MAG: hypothetical protein AB8H80_01460 [Planctomycetota bacterium]